jgi:tRNA(Ile)-lysidine synthase
MVELNGMLSASRNRDYIIFQATNAMIADVQHVESGNSYDYNGCIVSISRPQVVPAVYNGTHEVEYVDAERLGKQLVLRSWHAGDWFIPLGMKTKKKLSDFFTDQKVPRYQKSAIPVLESDGSIVWVCGKRLDDRFKLTARTRTAIRLSCHQAI